MRKDTFFLLQTVTKFFFLPRTYFPTDEYYTACIHRYKKTAAGINLSATPHTKVIKLKQLPVSFDIGSCFREYSSDDFPQRHAAREEGVQPISCCGCSAQNVRSDSRHR